MIVFAISPRTACLVFEPNPRVLFVMQPNRSLNRSLGDCARKSVTEPDRGFPTFGYLVLKIVEPTLAALVVAEFSVVMSLMNSVDGDSATEITS